MLLCVYTYRIVTRQCANSSQLCWEQLVFFSTPRAWFARSTATRFLSRHTSIYVELIYWVAIKSATWWALFYYLYMRNVWSEAVRLWTVRVLSLVGAKTAAKAKLCSIWCRIPAASLRVCSWFFCCCYLLSNMCVSENMYFMCVVGHSSLWCAQRSWSYVEFSSSASLPQA